MPIIVKGSELKAGDIRIPSHEVIAGVSDPGSDFIAITYVGNSTMFFLNVDWDYTVLRPVGPQIPPTEEPDLEQWEIDLLENKESEDIESGAYMRLSADVLHSDEEASKFGMTHRLDYSCEDSDGMLIADTEYYASVDSIRSRALEIFAESAVIHHLLINELGK